MFLNLSISTIIVLIIAIIFIYEYVYKFYAKVKLYPPGPMPLPIIGNCLMLRTHLGKNMGYFFKDMAIKYGDCYTFWLTTKPIVIINGLSLAKEAFNKNEFCDRFEPSLELQIYDWLFGGHRSWVMMPIGEEFKQLRSLSAQSLRKYLSNDKFSKITREIVSETVDVMKQRENGDAFEPFKYTDSLFIRLFIESIFGQKVSYNDHFIEQILLYFKYFETNFVFLYFSKFVQLFKYFVDWKRNKKTIDNTLKSFSICCNNVTKQTLNDDNCGNISEALICCANALKANNTTEENEFLNDSNMTASLITLFLGANTTNDTFKWIFLLMAYYPEMQQKMRDEINNNIGNKSVDVCDKEKCVYVNAFICETLRLRNPTPLSLSHMTSTHITLGDVSIPKQTAVLLNQLSILNNSRYWKDPDIFNPERFIDTEQNLLASKISAFIPFGTGKRMCVGDKFAMNTLFVVLASLLQATNGNKFVLPNKQSTDLEPMNYSLVLDPKIFKVCLISDK